LVPLRFLARIGLKVTRTWQVLPPAASVLTQFWLAVYPLPATEMRLMLIATGLLLLRVTGFAYEVPA